MKLSALTRKAGLAAHGPDVEISGLAADSRAVVPGMLFAALPGVRADGADFITAALDAGATAVLARRRPDPELPAGVALVLADDVRRAFARLAAAYFARQPETVVAVTGTSGKTSVAGFARQIWEKEGLPAASIGTLGVVAGDHAVYGSLTTPDTVHLHGLLADLAGRGVTHLAMEASSHGLEQRRLDGVELAAAAFTNLGRDHLDYHKDQDDYFRAKLGLFERLLGHGGTAVLDPDEPFADRMAGVCRERGIRLLTVGRSGMDLRLVEAVADGAGQNLVVEALRTTFHIRLPLIGAFQVSNALISAGLAIATGVPVEAALDHLTTLAGAPGRLQHVGDHRSGARTFVDYAHKPDALETVLKTLRPYTTNRLIVVFGAGGDRDRGKRALMGAVAERHADVVIVTDDNPRTEDPAAIRREIVAAAPSALEIGDRAEAIGAAAAMLQAGDVLVVAGKGHEEGQIIGERRLPFSDSKVLAEALAR